MGTPRIRLGVSSCLLGELVRYDGRHKRDTYVARTLARYVEFVPVCPEVAIGMGVPRPPIHLVGRVDSPRAIGRDDTAIDVTTRLADYGRSMAHKLDDLSGYVFKSRSPSCGVHDVPVYNGPRIGSGRGIYAQAFLSAHPSLPVEDEQRLTDPAVQDNFLERVFAYRRWQDLVADGLTVEKLMTFHAAHKYALMAHRPSAVSTLGRVISGIERSRLDAAAKWYFQDFMAALACEATPARHKNTLAHVAGYLRGKLSRKETHSLHASIQRFRTGRLPRAKVLTILRSHFRRHPDPYIARQTYLYPDPLERKLRKL